MVHCVRLPANKDTKVGVHGLWQSHPRIGELNENDADEGAFGLEVVARCRRVEGDTKRVHPLNNNLSAFIVRVRGPRTQPFLAVFQKSIFKILFRLLAINATQWPQARPNGPQNDPGIQGYLAHRKHQLPEDYHRSLGIGFCRVLRDGCFL